MHSPELYQGYWDPELETQVIHQDGPWIVSVSPMLFNDRVLLTHEDQRHLGTYTSGYCYDKGAAAALAAAAWFPTRQLQPVGFKKIAAEGREPKHLEG